MATGPRRTAGTRGADMAEEEGVNEGQEPEGGQSGGEGAGGIFMGSANLTGNKAIL